MEVQILWSECRSFQIFGGKCQRKKSKFSEKNLNPAIIFCNFFIYFFTHNLQNNCLNKCLRVKVQYLPLQ